MHDEDFRECVRPAGLQAWVHAAHQRQAPTAGAFVRLPMPWMSLTLQLGAGGIWQDGRGVWRSFPRLALRGLFDAPSAAAEAPHERVHYALALLQPWACEPLFGLPAALLRNEVLDLETVLPDWAARLLEAAGSGEPMDALLAALRERVGVAKLAPAAAWAMRLQSSGGAGPLYRLLPEIPERTLREHFNQQLGMPPKRYARLLRFTLALRAQHARPWHLDFCEPALAPHYCDQAHAIHEFQSLAGCTPGAYRAAKIGEPRTVFTRPQA